MRWTIQLAPGKVVAQTVPLVPAPTMSFQVRFFVLEALVDQSLVEDASCSQQRVFLQ